jgi:hypothetical protein
MRTVSRRPTRPFGDRRRRILSNPSLYAAALLIVAATALVAGITGGAALPAVLGGAAAGLGVACLAGREWAEHRSSEKGGLRQAGLEVAAAFGIGTGTALILIAGGLL